MRPLKIKKHGLEEYESSYWVNDADEFEVFSTILNCGAIKKIVVGKVISIDKIDEGDRIITIDSGDDMQLSDLEYKLVCEDYGMSKIVRGTLMRFVYGDNASIGYIYN